MLDAVCNRNGQLLQAEAFQIVANEKAFGKSVPSAKRDGAEAINLKGQLPDDGSI